MNLLRALQAKSGPVGSWFHTIKEIDFIFRCCCARLVRIQLIKRCEIRYRIKILPENIFFKRFRAKRQSKYGNNIWQTHSENKTLSLFTGIDCRVAGWVLSAPTLEAASQATPHAAHVECTAFGMGAQTLDLAHKSEYSFQC